MAFYGALCQICYKNYKKRWNKKAETNPDWSRSRDYEFLDKS